MSLFIDTYIAIKPSDGQDLRSKASQHTIDSVALKALIQDMILHSEGSDDYLTILQRPDAMCSSTSVFPDDSDLMNSTYGENECLFLENAGILVRNPSNHAEFRLVDFF
jgi:hypothetical protein